MVGKQQNGTEDIFQAETPDSHRRPLSSSHDGTFVWRR